VETVKAKVTFAELLAMTPADLYAGTKQYVSITKAVDKAKNNFIENLKEFSMHVAAMKRRYTTMREKHEIALDIPFKKFFKDNVKGDLPGRVEAMAGLFNSLVLTLDAAGKPLLSEQNFMDAAVDWLEKANAIVKAAQKEHGDDWKTCDDVLDTVNALSKPGDASKKLRDIRKRQKGESTTEGETAEAVPMTPEMAADYLVAAITTAGKMPVDKAAGLFLLCKKLPGRLEAAWVESKIADATLDGWTKNIARGVAPELTVITAPETGAPTDAAAAPAPAETAPVQTAADITAPFETKKMRRIREDAERRAAAAAPVAVAA
jgi:hypothetical protein